MIWTPSLGGKDWNLASSTCAGLYPVGRLPTVDELKNAHGLWNANRYWTETWGGFSAPNYYWAGNLWGDPRYAFDIKFNNGYYDQRGDPVELQFITRCVKSEY